MFLELLEKLRNSGVENVINTSTFDVSSLQQKFERVQYIEDVRSAIFTAYGIAKISSKPILAIVDDEYLPNTYTGLTEAWFQRVPVVVLSINSRDKESSTYLERCLDKISFIDINDSSVKLDDISLSTYGPTLIKTNEVIGNITPIDYSEIYSSLQDSKYSNCIGFFNSNTNFDGCRNIDPKYKYGLISKYVGQLLGESDNILVITENQLILDSNIFNFRDMPSKFKLIVKVTDHVYWNKFNGWLSSNEINVIDLTSNNESTNLINALDNCPVAILTR